MVAFGLSADDLAAFGKSGRDARVDIGVVDEFFFDQGAKIPFCPQLLTGGERRGHGFGPIEESLARSGARLDRGAGNTASRRERLARFMIVSTAPMLKTSALRLFDSLAPHTTRAASCQRRSKIRPLGRSKSRPFGGVVGHEGETTARLSWSGLLGRAGVVSR